MYAKHILHLRRRGSPVPSCIVVSIVTGDGHERYLGAVIKDTINGPPIKYN